MTSKQQSELQKLNFLSGKWTTIGIVKKTDIAPEIEIHGTDTYEFVANGFFILHTVDVIMGNEKVDNIEIIYFDQDSENYLLQSVDNFGKSSVITGTLQENKFQLQGGNIRSTLTFGIDKNQMTAT